MPRNWSMLWTRNKEDQSSALAMLAIVLQGDPPKGKAYWIEITEVGDKEGRKLAKH